MFFLCVTMLVVGPIYGSDQPFWKTKEKVKRKIERERAIVVSVRDLDEEKPKKRLQMSGAGLSRTPLDWTFQRSREFDKLKEISDHFKEVRWNEEKKELYVHTEAFRYHARMHMKINAVDQPDGKRLEFEVVRGSFTGLKGHFGFEPRKPKSTLIGFVASYEYTKLPMPAFFVEFGLEVILQRVAGAMRSYLEKAYKAENAKASD